MLPILSETSRFQMLSPQPEQKKNYLIQTPQNILDHSSSKQTLDFSNISSQKRFSLKNPQKNMTTIRQRKDSSAKNQNPLESQNKRMQNFLDRIQYIPHKETSPRSQPKNLITTESKKTLNHFQADNLNNEDNQQKRFNQMGIKWKLDTSDVQSKGFAD